MYAGVGLSSKRTPRPRGRSLIALTGALSACSFVDLGGYSSGAPIVNDGGPTDDASRPEPGPGEGGATEPETGASEHPYVLAVRADAPVSWYRFEEDADANIARDEISGHDATVIGGAMGFGAEGIAGRGLACDGTGSGFDVGDVYDFDGKTPFTLELWIRPTPTRTEQRLIRKRREGTQLLGYVLYLTPDTNVAFEDWGVNLSAWTDTPLPIAFTHLVVTVAYAGGTGNATLWIDGQPQPHGGFDNTANAPNTNQPLRLVESFKGSVDELAIYDRALSATRILEHYRAGKPK